jgi:5-methylcytosine-specific restriction endonuclease McrA
MSLYPDYSSIKSYQDWKDEWYSQNCWDHNYEFVYKKGESGRITLYQQCNSCGKKHHKGVFKHSAVDNLHEKIKFGDIKKYDDALENNGPTYQRYEDEYRREAIQIILKKHHDKNEQERINKHNEYIEQARIKKDNWFKEHSEYLQTSKWKAIRQKVFIRDNFICQGCLEAPASEVHHLTYDHWKDELMFELISVCYNCHHNKIHKKC